MGEANKPFFEPEFNRSVKVQGGDDRLTSDAGALLLREAGHRLGLIESLASRLRDSRDADCVRYQLLELLRQRICSLALGYSTQDDLDRLAHDPALQMASWDRPDRAEQDHCALPKNPLARDRDRGREGEEDHQHAQAAACARRS